MTMNTQDIKAFLDRHFEDYEEYIVEVKTPDNQRKEFLVIAEVPQQLRGAVYEFTKGGGEFVGYEEVDLSIGENTHLLNPMDSLIISEHLFVDEGAIDIPVILDLPDPSKTPSEKIEQRFGDYAFEQGTTSHAEEYGSDKAPDELGNNLLSAAMTARNRAIDAHSEYPQMTMAALVNGEVSLEVNEQMETHDLHDAYGDVYYSDDVPLRDFAHWADDLFNDLGIETNLDDVLRDAFEDGCRKQDKSCAIDWFDQEIVINFHPTVAPDGYIDDGMITCDSVSGDAYNVVPDDEFRSTLQFLNISAQEYADHVMLLSGGNYYITSDRDDWAEIVSEHGSLDAWCPKADPSKDSLVSLPDLVTLIENTNGYGVLTWSINVNMKDLLSVPPGEKVTLSGGQIGFHDYINGSGHMEGCAIGSKEVQLDQICLIPDSLKRYGLDSVYGMTHSATQGDFEWPKEAKKAYLEQCKSIYLNNIKDRGLPESKAEVLIDDDGKGFFFAAPDQIHYLTDIYEACEDLYGERPALDHLLTDKDREELKIAAKSPSIDLNL